MRGKIKKKILSILAAVLSVVVTIVLIPQMATPAYADDGLPAIEQGSSVLANGAGNNTAQTVWYAGNAWRVIGYNGDGVASASGAMTLLASDNIKTGVPFNKDLSMGNDYKLSDLQNEIDNWYTNSFSSGEKAAVKERTLEVGEFTESWPFSTGVSGDAVENAFLWPLSTAEALEMETWDQRDLLKANDSWWLRSPGDVNHFASRVNDDGFVDYLGRAVADHYGVRPAFYLNLESVLFTSAAEGGKSSGAEGAGALKEIQPYNGKEWKVTVKDTNHASFSINTCEVTYDDSTGVITVPYSGVTQTGDNEYISAIVKNSQGEITYYGRITKASSAEDASVTINTSDKVKTGDKLYVFYEQFNGDQTGEGESMVKAKTDYASEPVAVPLQNGSHDWAYAGALEWTGNDTDGYTAAVAKYVCKNDETHKDEVTAELSEKTEAPTCTERGKTTYTATVTSEAALDGTERTETKEAKVTEAKGHSFTTYMSNGDATCTADGTKTAKCDNCDATDTITDKGSAKGHKWNAATCTEPKTCEVCGATEGKALGHKWGEWKQTKAPTRTEKGEETRICANDPSHKETRTIDPLDSHMVTFVNEDGTELQSGEVTHGETPEYTGKTPTKEADEDYHYIFSGWTPKIESVTADATYTAAFKAEAHSFGAFKTTKQATCTEAGEKQAACSKCDQVKTEEIPAAGHDWKDATCTEPKTCTVCGATEGDPLGHKWGEWNQTKAPTETEAGEEERVCENDPSHKETREVPPSGHTHKLTLVPATPAKRDTPGNKAYYTCSGCDKWFWDAEGKEEITDKEEVYVYWFPDVTAETVNATSLESIYWAAANSIVNGFKDGLFRPEDNCTREQFAIMLWRFAGQPAADLKSAEKFSDLGSFSNSTAKKAVAWAAEKGIVKGFEDGTFRPTGDISRAQMAVMIWRFAGSPEVTGISTKFSDIGSFTENVQKAIIWAEHSELVKGYKDGTFKPNDVCQRQHMAIILNRYNTSIKKYK